MPQSTAAPASAKHALMQEGGGTEAAVFIIFQPEAAESRSASEKDVRLMKRNRRFAWGTALAVCIALSACSAKKNEADKKPAEAVSASTAASEQPSKDLRVSSATPSAAAAQQRKDMGIMSEMNRVAVPLIEHRLTPEEVLKKGKDAEDACRNAMARIAAVPAAERTFRTTIEDFEQSLSDYMDVINRLTILKEIHPQACST